MVYSEFSAVNFCSEKDIAFCNLSFQPLTYETVSDDIIL